jgi:ABC-type transport system involved in multi-copper enzyme maturation permease subunit
MYIVAIVIGFVVFLFTFDAISGEKEARTLALALSNPVPRAAILFGKYLSTICTTLLVLFPGLCVSLIIVFITGTVPLTPLVLGEIAGFLLVATVFVACIAAFGMLSSVLARSANVSLLIAISFWLLFVAIIPNTVLFWGQSLFPIEPAQSVTERIQKEREDINKNAPQGSWSSSSDNPFLPQHELRAAICTKLVMSGKRIRDAWYKEMTRQVERTRKITYFSPVSLFQYACEAVCGGGYVRFRKNWDDLHEFQGRFLTFFKDKDAADKDSPHWYNPYEDYSTTKKKVSFAEVPQYTERTIPLPERISDAGIYFLAMILYTGVIFALTFVLFLRYDAR